MPDIQLVLATPNSADQRALIHHLIHDVPSVFDSVTHHDLLVMESAFAILLKKQRGFLVPDRLRHFDLGLAALAVLRYRFPFLCNIDYLAVIGLIGFHQRHSFAFW